MTHVYYELFNSSTVAGCTAALAHEVHVFVIAADENVVASPSTEAIAYQVIQVDADLEQAAGRRIRLALDEPLILEENQSIVVSIQMKLEMDQHLCIGYCNDINIDMAGTQLWSSAASEPYMWTDMATFGFRQAYTIMIEGSPL